MADLWLKPRPRGLNLPDAFEGGGGSGGGGSSSSGTMAPPSTSGTVPVYQFSGMPQADVNVQSAISNLYQNPALQQIYNQAQGSLGGIPQFQTGYNPANVTQQGLNVAAAAQGLPYAAQQVYQTAFDPQQALFQQLQQQVTDQTNAQLAASGLVGSPFAAGIMGQNLGNLDISWQNNLLNREAQGAQTMNQLLSTYGGLNQLSAQLQFMGPQSQMEVSQGLAGLQSAVLAQDQQGISDWMSYLHEGIAASGVAAQEQMALNQQNAQIQEFNAQMQMQEQQMQMQKQQQNEQMAMQGAQMGLGMLGGKGI